MKTNIRCRYCNQQIESMIDQQRHICRTKPQIKWRTRKNSKSKNAIL